MLGLGRFEGEDWNFAERTRIQKEQMQSWLYQQMAERRAAEQERRDAERAYQEAVCSRDKRALALDRMSEECRRRLNEATSRFNRALVSYSHRCICSLFFREMRSIGAKVVRVFLSIALSCEARRWDFA